MAKKSTFGVNTYRARSKPKIGRHKKRMNKHEKRNYNPYIGQGRACQTSLYILYIIYNLRTGKLKWFFSSVSGESAHTPFTTGCKQTAG